jgi:hypothetical protein
MSVRNLTKLKAKILKYWYFTVQSVLCQPRLNCDYGDAFMLLPSPG